jgi:hypothetical protein
MVGGMRHVVQMRETPTALVDLGPDGVVTVRIRNGARQSLADAKQNLDAALDERAGQRCPILVDIREAEPLEAEVRHYYSGQVLVDGFCALALLVDASPLGRMIGNVYLRVARPGIPTRLFTQPTQAHEWLTTQLQ